MRLRNSAQCPYTDILEIPSLIVPLPNGPAKQRIQIELERDIRILGEEVLENLPDCFKDSLNPKDRINCPP